MSNVLEIISGIENSGFLNDNEIMLLEFKDEVNVYLEQLFELEKLEEDSIYWALVSKIIDDLNVDNDNKELINLAYACVYVIMLYEDDSNFNTSGSISIGHISVGNVENEEKSLTTKAYRLLEQYGFLSGFSADVING
ncbi:hypothetical protein ABSA28_00542 [Candidatus Hepatincolaceae symbiont of Richtersius coronifer]